MVEVLDGSGVMPKQRSAGPTETSGRGLTLVEALAIRHGAGRNRRGKRVWAELELPQQPFTRRQLMTQPHRAAKALAQGLGGPQPAEFSVS
ncbi:ATP-binding protein [Kitasatospora acidiphila]|uniref:ATP-binding protein n=1 Tax=Kitasatospora acidiphila TaxID=2567942 RepID=A0A540WCJ8_9ACTN|nr:ATP-binding protein [Kitasatospora acidiphila]TQF06736.1 ATP-binding protein [Kitasatospora acidiphila]